MGLPELTMVAIVCQNKVVMYVWHATPVLACRLTMQACDAIWSTDPKAVSRCGCVSVFGSSPVALDVPRDILVNFDCADRLGHAAHDHQVHHRSSGSSRGLPPHNT